MSFPDYDTAKYLATRAMHHKVSPSEVRTPTHVWAGQGFSSSMPEAVIRYAFSQIEIYTTIYSNLGADR